MGCETHKGNFGRLLHSGAWIHISIMMVATYFYGGMYF